VIIVRDVTTTKPLQVLHVVVGHGLSAYFLNAVRSVRATAPTDPLLVIDNASPDVKLRHELRRLADQDDRIDVILRNTNDLTRNRKLGSLYSAYEIAFEYAIARGFDFLHLLQGDFQMLWWDADLLTKSSEIYDRHPFCVNIQLQFLSRDKMLAGGLTPSGEDGLMKLAWYGLTDTGLYHLGRWQAKSMRFGQNEHGHGKRYLAESHEVICHPWPTDAPIPWPAVMRNGVRRGREVSATKPYLLKPLPPQQVDRVKTTEGHIWLEDVCIPWGWVCATPMWVTSLDSIEYWVLRYRDAKKNGLRYVLPHWERRGVSPEDRRKILRIYRYRPSLFRLVVGAPMREIVRRLGNLCDSRPYGLVIWDQAKPACELRSSTRHP
jgi:hypothetical protein